MSKVRVLATFSEEDHKRIYRVQGPLFFASVMEFLKSIDFKENIFAVEIDLTHYHLWDDSAIGALDKVEAKFEQNGVAVYFKGMNKESTYLHNRIGGLSKNLSH